MIFSEKSADKKKKKHILQKIKNLQNKKNRALTNEAANRTEKEIEKLRNDMSLFERKIYPEEKETLSFLKELINLPQIKDLRKMVVIKSFSDDNSGRTLFLTTRGLLRKRWYHGRCTCIEHTFGCSSSWENEDKVEPSIDLIKSFDIGVEGIRNLIKSIIS